MTDELAQFLNHNYLNLESYRKTGKPVATPMWFALDNDTLYVYSLANAGKVKRVRNNSRVRVVPCDMRGNPRGQWVEAKARILDDAGAEFGHRLLNEKYGWMKKIGNIYSRLMNRERVVMAIEII